MEPVYFYDIKTDHTVSLTRMYGETDIAYVPEYIDGRLVTEIGKYCFAPNGRYEKREIEEERFYGLKEMAKDAVKKVILPKSVKKIGRNAFYNCKGLVEIEITDSLTEIESDIFMNCVHLDKIVFHGNPTKKNVLKQMLAQISWGVELDFLWENEEAVFFFPEYSEAYSEIGPAHIFELNIQGEGFRSRQCFSDNCFLVSEYDAIFPQAMAEESVQTLSRMAMNRIAYPYALSKGAEQIYRDYIKEHGAEACMELLQRTSFSQQQLCKIMEKMMAGDCISLSDMENIIAKVAELGMAELLSHMMDWKKSYKATAVSDRYSFDDF